MIKRLRKALDLVELHLKVRDLSRELERALALNRKLNAKLAEHGQPYGDSILTYWKGEPAMPRDEIEYGHGSVNPLRMQVVTVDARKADVVYPDGMMATLGPADVRLCRLIRRASDGQATAA